MRAPSLIGYSLVPSGDNAIASMPRLRSTPGAASPRYGFCGDIPNGGLDRRAEEHAVGVEVDDERPELVADPERPVRCALHRLDVEVAAGEQALGGVLVDDREADDVVRITERDEVVDDDLSAAAGGGLPVRRDVVQAQQEVGRVLDRPEAVVGHRPEGAVVVGRPRRRTRGRPGRDTEACGRWPGRTARRWGCRRRRGRRSARPARRAGCSSDRRRRGRSAPTIGGGVPAAAAPAARAVTAMPARATTEGVRFTVISTSSRRPARSRRPRRRGRPRRCRPC